MRVRVLPILTLHAKQGRHAGAWGFHPQKSKHALALITTPITAPAYPSDQVAGAQDEGQQINKHVRALQRRLLAVRGSY